MIAYGLEAILLIKEFQSSHPKITQSWYADNSGAGGTFPRLQDHLDNIIVRGNPREYFPDPTKSILVVLTHYVVQKEHFFRGRGLTIRMGSRYLGGYIGDAVTQVEWLCEKMQYWKGRLKTIAGVEHKYLQASYTGIQKSLQQEWDFTQRAT